jgi:hypothetical protein
VLGVIVSILSNIRQQQFAGQHEFRYDTKVTWRSLSLAATAIHPGEAQALERIPAGHIGEKDVAWLAEYTQVRRLKNL